MRRNSDGTPKVGDRLYDVNRYEGDNKLHLWITELTDVITGTTPTGRPRKPIYKGKPVNYRHGNSDEPFQLDPDYYYTSAANAVNASLRNYFERKCGRSEITPEERLLKSVFGEDPNPRVAATELVDVIYDLKNYHALYAEAFAEDDRQVQAIPVP